MQLPWPVNWENCPLMIPWKSAKMSPENPKKKPETILYLFQKEMINMTSLLNDQAPVCTSALVNRSLSLTRTYLIEFKILERIEPECFSPLHIIFIITKHIRIDSRTMTWKLSKSELFQPTVEFKKRWLGKCNTVANKQVEQKEMGMGVRSCL